jgi:type II secretory pathway component GspD/PulD (secretin)
MNLSANSRAGRIALASLALALLLAPRLSAQTDTPADAKRGPESTEVFRLANASQNNAAATDLTTALRNTLGARVHVYNESAQNTILVHGTAEEIEQARKIIAELDKPAPTYRLTYSITQVEDGKRVGTQRYVLLAAAGKRVDLKEGRKVPIITGKTGDDASALTTQVQYIDVGLNISATVDGSSLRSKIEESTVDEEKSNVDIQDPVIRQITLQGDATFTFGKPTPLGSIDIPNSTRHQEVEVLVERVQ